METDPASADDGARKADAGRKSSRGWKKTEQPDAAPSVQGFALAGFALAHNFGISKQDTPFKVQDV